MKKKIISLISVACLLLVMVPAITLISGATADVCPQMPLGATNYADPDKMFAIGEEASYYNNGGLLMTARNTAHVIHDNGMVLFELDDAVTTADPYVISTWNRSMATGMTTYYAVRFLEDTDGNYYEIQYSGDQAVLKKNTVTLSTYTVPSTGLVLGEKNQTTNNGTYKQLDIYVQPGEAAGTVDVQFFVAGEAMKDANGNATVNLAGTVPVMVLGNKAMQTVVRGIRLYKVDPNATEFEDPADPMAEISGAENGVAGGDFIVENPTTPYPALTIEQLRVPQWANDVDLSAIKDYPRLPEGGINYALGIAASTQNTDAVYDANNGYISLISNNWNPAKFRLALNGIEGDDNFVISFWTQRPYTWGQDYPLEIVFGTDGTKTQKITSNMYETVYTDADGKTKQIATLTAGFTEWSSGVPVAIHCYPDGKGTRTINIYGDGKLIAHLTEQAILPVAFNVSGASNNAFPFNFLGLRAYLVDPDATEFEDDAVCDQEQPVKNFNPAILPGQVAGSSNYATDPTVGGVGGTMTENEDGSITFSGTAYMNGGQLKYPLDGIRSNHDYVMKFKLNGLVANGDGWNPFVYMTDSVFNTYIRFNLNDGTNFYDHEGNATPIDFDFSAGEVELAIYATYDASTTTRTYRLFVNGGYVQSFEGLPAADPYLMITSPNAGTETTVSDVLVYNPNGDPYEAPAMPSRPSDANNWVWDDATNIVLSANQTTIDKDTNTITMVQAGSAKAILGVPSHVLKEDFVLNFNFKMAAGWFNNALVLEICDEAIVQIHKSDDQGGMLINGIQVLMPNQWNDLMDSDGLNVKVYVHPMEEGSEKKAIDFYVGGNYLGSVSNTDMTNPRIVIRSSTEQWNGEYIGIYNADLYCPNGEPEPLPELPEKPDNAKEYANEWTVTGFAPTYTENEDGSITINDAAYMGGGKLNYELAGINATDDYVMEFTINKLNGDWYRCEPAIHFTNSPFDTYVSFDFRETGHRFIDGAGVAQPIGYTFTAGVNKFIVFADYDEATDTRDYHLFVGGKYAASFKDQPAADPYLMLRSDEAGWGTTLSGVSAWKLVETEEETGFTVTVDELPGGTVTGAPTDAVAYGETVTLTAEAADGYTFMYWMVGNRTYTGATLTWTVTDDVVITPVYAADEAPDYTVTYRSRDGRVVARLSLNQLLSGTATAPAVPTRYGYTGGRWESVILEEITSDIDVYPLYTKAAETYTVTVNGGTASKTTAKFEEYVTVTATIDNFVAWTVDGKVVSTAKTYSFYLPGNVTLTAVSDATIAHTVTAPTVLGVTNADDSTKFRLTAIVNTYVADGSHFVEAGIVYSTTNADPEIGADGAKKKASSTTKAGQFMYSLNNAPVDTPIYVRGYVVVKDAEGNLSTVYGAVETYRHTA